MKENITLTTGQTCGLTGLSLQTIQRYVRAYSMGFSPEARKPVKGRRFNGDDIKNLLVINHLLHSKQKSKISKVLRGELDSPDLALFEVNDFLMMFNTITALAKNLESFYLEVKQEKEFLQRAAPIIRNHSQMLEVLRFDVSRLKMRRTLSEGDFDHPVKAVHESHEQARKGVIARWFEGDD